MPKNGKHQSSESSKSIAAFGEDRAHEKVVGALINRVADEVDIEIETEWYNSRRGHGKVVAELEQYFLDIKKQGAKTDLIVIVTDANCKGFGDRLKEIPVDKSPFLPIICAIPDPHVERWLLLDSEAFKKVFGRGYQDVGYKCERHFYKNAFRQACLDAGVHPYLEIMDCVDDIVLEMDFNRAGNKDPSFQRFLDDLRRSFK